VHGSYSERRKSSLLFAGLGSTLGLRRKGFNRFTVASFGSSKASHLMTAEI
jgi:hypothetical protein